MLFVVFLSIFCGLVLSQCSVEVGQTMPIPNATDCIRAYDYVETTAADTIDILSVFSHLYPYTDIIKDGSGDPFNVKADLDELAAIKAKTDFPNDYDFQMEVQKLFRSLRDRHSMYIPPSVYSSWVFLQPFGLKRVNDQILLNPFGKQDKSYFATLYAEGISILTGIPGDFTFFTQDVLEHDVVTHINGIEVNTFLRSRAQNIDECSFSKDISVCYNYILKNWGTKSMATNILPKPEDYTISYTFASDSPNLANRTIDVFWVGAYAGAPPKSVNLKSGKYAQDVEKYYFSKLKAHVAAAAKRKAVARIPKTRKAITDPVEGDHFTIDPTFADDTLVIKIKSFTSTDALGFANDLGAAWKNIDFEARKNILVDVRGVSGEGSICSAFLMARYISKLTPRDPYPNTDQKHDIFGKTLHCAGVAVAYEWGVLYNSKRQPASVNWYFDGPNRRRGNTTSQYTDLVHSQCGLFYYYLFKVSENFYTTIPQNDKIVYPEDIYIVTDGTCGGTCGIFTNLFKQLNLGRVITQGGIPGRAEPPKIASFPGSLGITLQDTIDHYQVTSVICGGVEGFHAFSNDALATVSKWELYPWTPLEGAYDLSKADAAVNLDSLPLEFTNEKGHINLENYDFTGDTIYTDIQTLFFGTTNCFAGEIKIDSEGCTGSIANAIFGRPCVMPGPVNGSTPTMGTWDTANCETKGCVPGYYLNTAGDACMSMPGEYFSYTILLIILICVIVGLVVLPIGLIVFCCMLCVGCYCCSRTCKKLRKKQNLLRFRRMKDRLNNESGEEMDSDDGSGSGSGSAPDTGSDVDNGSDGGGSSDEGDQLQPMLDDDDKVSDLSSDASSQGDSDDSVPGPPPPDF